MRRFTSLRVANAPVCNDSDPRQISPYILITFNHRTSRHRSQYKVESQMNREKKLASFGYNNKNDIL